MVEIGLTDLPKSGSIIANPKLRQPVVPGGAGGAMEPTDFGISVNPISTFDADYVHYFATCYPKIFRPSYGPEKAAAARCF